ncbi:hypothetical protein ABZ907_24070 [Nonomuraea wenchangensis]
MILRSNDSKKENSDDRKQQYDSFPWRPQQIETGDLVTCDPCWDVHAAHHGFLPVRSSHELAYNRSSPTNCTPPAAARRGLLQRLSAAKARRVASCSPSSGPAGTWQRKVNADRDAVAAEQLLGGVEVVEDGGGVGAARIISRP